MAIKLFTVTRETGTSISEITDYILREANLENVSAQFRCRIEEWMMENNHYRYRWPIGEKINLLTERNEIISTVSDPIPFLADGTSGTTSQSGWKLMLNGDLVPGATGWLIDEFGLFILRDGRRVSMEIIERYGLEHLIIGNKDSSEKGLQEILGRPYEESTDVELNVAYLFANYNETMPDIVYQAFQINIGHNQRISEYEIVQGVKFYNYGFDESGIPLVVTQIGNEYAKHKIIISGPHGDERCALRLILMVQRRFSREPTLAIESDSVFYFIPAMTPTFYFADARGLPIVNKYGKMDYEDNIEASIAYAIENIDIPLLHDNIVNIIDVPESPNKKETLRTAIQQYNRNNRFAYYPKYGIDTNRDSHSHLSSIQSFYRFVEKLPGDQKTVILLHGYASTKISKTSSDPHQGCIYPQYYIVPNINKAEVYPDRIAFCKLIRKALGWNKPQMDDNGNEESFLYLSTKNDPDYYKGEIIRYFAELIPGEKRIYAFDIELPHIYDEGRREAISPYNRNYENAVKQLELFTDVFFDFLKEYYKYQDQENHDWRI
jgi:hypothetical protein